MRKVPLRTIIEIECTKKSLQLRLLGGDSILFWEENSQDKEFKMRELA